MRTAKVDTLAWVAIYGGMALVGLGLSIRNDDAGVGLGVALAGGAGIVVGAVLVWVRSRINAGDGT